MNLSLARSLVVSLGVALLVIAPPVMASGSPVVPVEEKDMGTLGSEGDKALDGEGTSCEGEDCGYSPEEQAQLDASSAAPEESSEETTADDE